MPRMREKLALPLYLVLTFASSWALWFASGVLAYGGRLPPLDRGWLLAQIGVFCPSLWALAFTAVLRPERRRHCLALLLGLFLPATLLGLHVADRAPADPLALPATTRILFPLLAAIVLAAFTFPRRLLLVAREPLGRRTLRWSLAAALQLPLLFLAGWLLIGLTAGELGVGRLAPDPAAALPGLAILCAFDLVFGGALGEELGWRGFALPLMLRRQRPAGAALTLGVVWSLWHLPIDLAAGFGATGVGALVFRLLFTCALSVIVTWYFLHSGHGMLTALLIHATLNWLPVAGFSHYESAMALLCVLMFLFALLVLFGDSRFRRDPPGEDEGTAVPGPGDIRRRGE